MAVATTTSCPACGSQLANQGKSQGLCPGCLLDTALRETSHDLDETVAWSHAEPEASDAETDRAAAGDSIPESIGEYRILGKLGEGGMGIVFEAEQQNPKRRVALKVVRGGQYVDESQVKMFQREAETLGRLKHANIGAIHESGRTDGGQHFFAMELVRGETLDAHLSRFEGRITPAELNRRLRLFQKITDAVHYAHQRGVIHRDLKPSNIIVTDPEGADESTKSGIPEIKILDFGLARITEGDIAAATVITEVGLIKGTLPYMSPEQARGLPEEIDLRTDVYALGVILYEMLGRQRPYDTHKSALIEAVRVIQETPPRPLRQDWKGTRTLDKDVETIVGKALEKEADLRYDSAASLSEDIGRYLTSQPIRARPPSTIYQLRKLVSRNKTGTVFAATVLALLIGTGIWISVLYVRALDAESAALQSLDRSEASKLMALARLEEERFPTAALAYATKSLELVDTPEARRLALEIPWQGPVARVLLNETGMGTRFSISPDGQWLAWGIPHKGKVYVFTRNGILHTILDRPENDFGAHVDFGPESDRLVASMIDENLVHIFSLPAGELIRAFDPGPAGRDASAELLSGLRAVSVTGVVGDQILAATFDIEGGTYPRGHLDSWPLAGGPPTRLMAWDEPSTSFSAWESSGSWSVEVDDANRSVYWAPLEDLSTERSTRSLLATHDEPLKSLAFSDRGHHLYGGDGSGRVVIWDLDHTSVQRKRIVDDTEMENTEGIGDRWWKDFAPVLDSTGRWLAWGSSLKRFSYLKDLQSPPDSVPFILARHDEDLTSMGLFDPHGEWLATRHAGSLSFWSLQGSWSRRFSLATEPKDIAVTSDGRYLATCSEVGGVALLPLVPGARAKRTVTRPGSECSALATHPASSDLTVSLDFGDLRTVSVGTDTSEPLANVSNLVTTSIAYDPHHPRLAVAFGAPANSALEILSLNSGDRLTVPFGDVKEGMNHGVFRVRFLADGTLVTAGWRGARRWYPERGTSEEILDSGRAALDVSQDGRFALIAAGDYADGMIGNSEIFILDIETDQRRQITTHGESIQSVLFGPTGQIIITGDADGIVRVGPATGEEPHSLLGHKGHVENLAVSPDGRWIFSRAQNEIRMWPTPHVSQPPPLSLPADELLKHLHSLTNLRVVEAPETPEGWKLEIGPFQ